MPPNPLPSPPADCADLDFDPAVTTAGALAAELGLPHLALWRVGGVRPGRVGHPLTYVERRAYPRFRFDDPSSGFLTWYGSRTAEGAFMEVFGERSAGIVTPDQRVGRVAGTVAIPDDLELLDLRAPKVVQIGTTSLRLDDRIGTTELYSLTQAWAGSIHECDEAVGGVIYRARLGGEIGPNVALFVDRITAASPLGLGQPVDHASFDDARALLDACGVRWG